MYKTTVGQIL